MQVIHFDEIDSTNTYLRNHYRELDSWTVVYADYQKHGKGRHERQWNSDSGKNVLMSILIKGDNLEEKFSRFSMNCAYLVMKVLEEYGIKNLSMKWPNDILVNNKKICGILLESVSVEEMQCVIIGIGVNVNQSSFTGEFITEPTSVIIETGQISDVKEMVLRIACTINENIYSDNLDNIMQYNYLAHKDVVFLKGDKILKGKVLGINSDYSLKIAVDGKEENVKSGEVSFHI